MSMLPQVQRAPRFVARRKSAPKRLALEDRYAQVLAVVRREGSVAPRALQVELGWGRSMLRDVLRHLAEHGQLAMSAESRSPFQRYRLAGGSGRFKPPSQAQSEPPATSCYLGRIELLHRRGVCGCKDGRSSAERGMREIAPATVEDTEERL